VVSNTDPDEEEIEQSDKRDLEQRLTALEEQNEELKATLEQWQNDSLSRMTRRGAMGLLGGGVLFGAAGSASADPEEDEEDNGGPPFSKKGHDHSGDYLGEGEPVDQIDAGDVNNRLYPEGNEIASTIENAVGGQTVYLPTEQTIYEVDNPINVRSSIRIVGAGRGLLRTIRRFV